MNWNIDDIEEEIRGNWAQLKDNAYPDDLLTEWADSACPIYYSDIIKDWQEMPNEFTDKWQEFYEPNNETTIFYLMSLDLGEYYRDAYLRIYEVIKNEKESEEN